MKTIWTSSKPINGLRHFVLVDKINEKDKIKNLMVSVLDVEISLRISNQVLINKDEWTEGWLNLPKSESITKDYLEYKLSNDSKKGINKIYINVNSIFNIS
tara:strand:- start:742 stop:1044 length:303 start_codon:yes stop_codon:yes gene_type:complete